MAVTLRSVKGSALTHEEMDANFLAFPKILATSGAAIANTGNTTENVLVTVVVPGGAMGVNGFIRVVTTWTTTGNTNTKTMKVLFNGTAFNSITHTSGTNLISQTCTIISNRNSLSSQVGYVGNSVGFTVGSNGAVVTSTHNTAGDLNLTITAQCNTSGSDTITLERYAVEIGYAA